MAIAQRYTCPIVSSDSRQFFRELKIGTAAPTVQELETAKHYMIGSHSIFDTYNAGQYEIDAIELLSEIFKTNTTAMLVGGSMLYIDAVCKGIDDIPTIDQKTRQYWKNQLETHGLEYLLEELKIRDPKHFAQVDPHNHQRILHALEVCSQTGKTYSELRTGKTKMRPFNILKIGLNRNRPELYERINTRVLQMMSDGLLEEARQFYAYRHLNTLNTVGYKELFAYFANECTLDQAIALIQQNSRHYAKKQLSWFHRDKDIHWFHPDNQEAIFQCIERYK